MVRFYLLDHRTPVGRAIDVALLSLNLLFVAVFVVETYPHSAATDAWLWRLEVGIAAVFTLEYALRIYGAENRLGGFTNPHTVEVTCPNCGLRRHDADASHCTACGHVIYQECVCEG